MTETTGRPAVTKPVIAAIAVAVLAAVAGVIWLVRANSDPASADYQVTVRGNISANWNDSGTGAGSIDVSTGAATQTIHAGSFTLTVESTLPNGASCVVKDATGKVVAEDGGLPADGTTGLSASSTATCTVR
ncbi:hypothetical protein L3Q65_46045 [Amycolatopsis sp. FU40]|uniref:hypothetical protein n=1 Tax=Amycolatopsis sp. FU40 TaxID=2914159 RepID=UPI001F480D59|nr:hypothetical protein [Amycolatopsis sp. FU40]UKD55137.1 hypothetical protein L3Q65_46045 [Amycolatopsis sp. FU40]